MKKYAYLSLCLALASCAIFKGGKKKNQKKSPATTTATKPATPANKNGVKPFKTIIKPGFQHHEGLFTVHNSVAFDSLFFEIPDSLFGRDIMVINRISKMPGGMHLYAGESLDESMISFEKGPNENIRIRYRYVISDADSTNAISRAVKNSNNDPVIETLPIKAYGKDSLSYVVDVSKMIKDNRSLFNNVTNSSFTKNIEARSMRDHEVLDVTAYPINVNVKTLRNNESKGDSQKGVEKVPVSVETITSFVLLPKVPMQRRIFDPRVGFFADYSYEYADDQQKINIAKFINRWRLEPKPEDVERYKRGELVEPKQPIVYYIDPATPKQWRKYLILGVNDWQKAFEAAGFKNAIIAKEWPENDSTMHLDDARYSFINYFPSEIANAYGPNVHDPRSGQIIQSHIGWYHNVMQLVHDWYMIQAGPNDPQARKAKFDTELMGQLIRFVSSHEVGHTLGLRHNFGSSSKTPVDSLRSISYLRKHGHTASIMDYARFNYVAQPEDHIPQELLFPRIGEYDTWAIKWGYKDNFTPDDKEDKKIMNRMTTAALQQNDRLWFGDGETMQTDPRNLTEDLGDDVIKANTYGIKNLKRVMDGLPNWTQESSGFHNTMAEMYKQVQSQYFRYMNHVIRQVGATMFTIHVGDYSNPAYVPVSREKQVRALKFFNDELFNTPNWLLDSKVTDIVGNPDKDDFLMDLQARVINTLLDAKKLNAIIGNENRFGDKTIGIKEFLSILHNGVWNELNDSHLKIDTYRRPLQKAYIGALSAILLATEADVRESDAATIANAELQQLDKQIKQASTRTSDFLTKAHLSDLSSRIKKVYSN
ncbi:zinc-dependent metalloprotease [Chitinophaga caeni]|uniref:Zinc-dependent metalloprotease n=1 Tax=Chitinophaga caeni TaxID=2029983 RepID=A0A291QZ25_9BACT|nr:zinc-dependent metalloprotease [Chitinophaga caeni]ATL49210.1 zinc-dependent metalloprotease [Chitinophaga caeni]